MTTHAEESGVNTGEGVRLPPLDGLNWQCRLRGEVYLVGSTGSQYLVRWPSSYLLDSEEEVSFARQAASGWIDASIHDAEHLSHLLQGGWLELRIISGDTEVLTVSPRRAAPQPINIQGREIRVSRFAVLHQSVDRLQIELPHSWADVEIHDSSMLPWIFRKSTDQITGGTGLDMALLWLGVWCVDDEPFESKQWAPHELWFHERTRRYGRSKAFGGTFWAKDVHEPLPASLDLNYRSEVELPVPDIGQIESRSASLYRVLEDRRTFRQHDDETPISLQQLGEFLYRTCRTRMSHEVDEVEYLSRPHPSGGSAYELDTYVIVRQVAGLAPALYHYDPNTHRLGEVRNLDDGDINAILREATHSSTVENPPQVVVLMAARVGRILWKYQEMGYAVIIKHVGVLMQTMYLVATDMGLAPCAIGSGDSDLFNRTTNTSPLEQVTVGEFLLGSRSSNEKFLERPS